jgi:hypothetical protein
MSLIFHQNMRNYGGGAWLRNFIFDLNFAAMQAATGALYIAAGYTEIRNNLTALNFTARAAALDPGLTNGILIEVGITAVGNKIEHLGIAWDPTVVTVTNAGQVLYNAIARRWQCYNTAIPGLPPATIPLGGVGMAAPAVGAKRKFDETAIADSRGLAYIAGTYNGVNRVFAFMHNMYGLGDRSSAFTKLNTMVDAINATLGIGGTRTYMGGDFNLQPRDPRRGRALHHAAARNVANTAYLNTTAANPYDFWLSDQAVITHARASRRNETLNSGVSDHAGVVLRL